MSTELKPCPWCGGQPLVSSYRTGHRQEPIRIIQLKCKCGASRSVSPTSKEEDAALDRAYRSPDKPRISYDDALTQQVLPRLIEKWNTRFGE